jgi:hypothetical protein
MMKAPPDKPKTLFSAYNKDGSVNLELFRQYMQSVNEETVKYAQMMLSSEEEEASSVKPMTAPVFRKQKAVLEYYNDDNILQRVKPQESSWWFL